MQRRSSQYYDDTNGVPLEDGRTHHVGVAKGEVANRIVLVGSSSRAATLCSLLDGAPQFSIKSHRGFETYTGTFQGTPVSVVTTGMGGPMMDFAVRELRHVVDGDLILVRLGSCGGLAEEAVPGVVVANTPGSVRIARNFDADFADFPDESDANYIISQRRAAPDGALARLLAAELAKECDVVEGLNASADSFYDAQGRVDPNFRDSNSYVLSRLKRLGVASVEMESFYLLHLAAHGTRIRAATCAVVAANRGSGAVVEKDAFEAVERKAGRAVLRAVVAALPADVPPPAPALAEVGSALRAMQIRLGMSKGMLAEPQGRIIYANTKRTRPDGR